MAAKALVGLDPVADLKRRLARSRARAANLSAELHESSVRRCVLRWWDDHGLGAHPASVGKRIAVALLEQPSVPSKLAGIVLFHELLADHLRTSDLLAFQRLFTARRLREVSIVDAFAVKVLGTMLHRVRGRAEVARGLASWRAADSVWQRRAACVAFTALAPQGDTSLPNLAQLVFGLCSSILWSTDRLDQTAVAWLLRELSRAEPTRVEAFVRRHARFMSRECARQAIERLPASRQQNVLAHWKRATTLTR